MPGRPGGPRRLGFRFNAQKNVGDFPPAPPVPGQDAYWNLVRSRSSLQMWWRFNEPGQLTAFDNWGHIDGRYYGAVTLGQSPFHVDDPATGVLFDGVTGCMAALGTAASSLTTTNALSVIVWANITAADGVVIASKAGGGGVYEWALYQFAGPTRVTGYVYTTGGGTVAIADGATTTTGRHQVAMTLDNTGKHQLIYIDGALGITQDTWSGTPGTGATTVDVGRRGDNNGQNWAGPVADFQIYNAVLTPTDIATDWVVGRSLYAPWLNSEDINEQVAE